MKNLVQLTGLIYMLTSCVLISVQPIGSNEKANGYRGIWFDLKQYSAYGSKYSGGLGTYTAKHVPLAIYAAEVDKTFFVYGGSPNGEEYLLCMIGCYDHETGKLARPTIVHDKQGVNDPHDNPSLSIDQEGYLWIFVSGRGQKRPGFKYRSTAPYNMDSFELIEELEMTYPQPWWIDDEGFLLLFTKYRRNESGTSERNLFFQSSPDGRNWTPHQHLAGMGGHYQTSRKLGNRIITAFNRHPGGLSTSAQISIFCRAKI